MIQGGPEIVHSIASPNAHRTKKSRKIRCIVNEENMLLGLNIELNVETWKILFDRERFSNIPIQGFSVFPAPYDFGPASVK